MTAPPPLWTRAAVIDWLGVLGIGEGLTLDLPLYSGPYIPETPPLLGVVTLISGAGESMEGIADTPGFMLLVRGEPNQPVTAETAALRADQLIRFAPFPMDVAGGGFRLIRTMRSGGAPAVLGGEDDGDSTTLTCNYLTELIR